MDLQLLADNLLSPPVLFFILGITATLLRSDLEIPDPIPRLFSTYLLWAIGFKGGVKLAAAGLSTETLMPLMAAVVFSFVGPLYVVPLLRRFLSTADACATAAAYGSVSAVTFITAVNFLDTQEIPYGGHLVAALALMEAPAIISAVVLFRLLGDDDDSKDPEKTGMLAMVREAFLSGPVFLLIGSMIAGALSGEKGFAKLQPFTEDVFYGVLVLFLLEAGMTAARRLAALKEVGVKVLIFATALPLLNAALAIVACKLMGLSQGDALLFTILVASASYIAVPAAMKLSIPAANPSIYLTNALAITFPFNIAIGIPLYLFVLGRVL